MRESIPVGDAGGAQQGISLLQVGVSAVFPPQ